MDRREELLRRGFMNWFTDSIRSEFSHEHLVVSSSSRTFVRVLVITFCNYVLQILFQILLQIHL